MGRGVTGLASSCSLCDGQQWLVSLQPTCQSQVQMVNGKLVVSKQCGSYRDCLLRERDNYRQCNVSHSGPVTSMQCTFCCTGIGCNQGDLGGQSVSLLACRVTGPLLVLLAFRC